MAFLRLARVVAHIGVWTALAVLFSGQYFAEAIYHREPVNVGAGIRSALAFSYVWAALAPLLAILVRRLARSSTPRSVQLAIAVVAAVGASAAHILLRRALGILTGLDGERSLAELFSSHLYINIAFAFGLLVIAAVRLTGEDASERAAEADEARLRAARLESELAQAQLHQLKSQLQPHFLLNALQGIATLLYREPRQAEQMLSTLGDLLRDVVQRSAAAEIPFRGELEFMERYVALQQMRFGDRLRVEFDIAPEVMSVSVPAYVLQPLVENAIQHGIAPRASGGTIAISARVTNGHIVLTVEDDGVGVTVARDDGGGGIGIANTVARLERLYGADAHLALEPRAGGGTRASIQIPHRAANG